MAAPDAKKKGKTAKAPEAPTDPRAPIEPNAKALDATLAELGKVVAGLEPPAEPKPTDLVEAMKAGKDAHSAEVHDILTRWHNHLRYFYEPTLDILHGLGEGYNTHPDFIAFFQQLHPDLPAYLQETITQYVDDLEYAEIAHMLAEDEAKRLQ